MMLRCCALGSYFLKYFSRLIPSCWYLLMWSVLMCSTSPHPPHPLCFYFHYISLEPYLTSVFFLKISCATYTFTVLYRSTWFPHLLALLYFTSSVLNLSTFKIISIIYPGFQNALSILKEVSHRNIVLF